MSLENSELESVGFSGIARVFPLPNLVLFPGVIQPLHIFEPRYRQMVRHALDGDGLIAIAVYRPNWEDSLASEPPIFDVVTIGKIIAHAEQEDGRCNILLKGVSRAKVIREIPTELLYRMADVSVIDEPAMDSTQLLDLRRQVTDRYLQLQKHSELDHQTAMQLVEQDLPLGTLVDMITFSTDFGVLEQQAILNTVEIGLRSRKLIQFLEQKAVELSREQRPIGEFPPEFSFN